jgi:hypothetical protein
MPSLYLNEDKNAIYQDPLKFISKLDKKKHIVLYYDNPTFGKKIQFRFIMDGLLKGENCIYVIHENDNPKSIENEMIDNGIDVKKYSKYKLLTIFTIPDILKHPNGVLKGSEEIIDKIFSDLNPNLPFRLVVRMIDKLNTRDQIAANLDLEQYYHSKFEHFNGFILCHYDVRHNPTNTNGIWVENILENHHSAIFVTENEEEGIAFDMSTNK